MYKIAKIGKRKGTLMPLYPIIAILYSVIAHYYFITGIHNIQYFSTKFLKIVVKFAQNTICCVSAAFYLPI